MIRTVKSKDTVSIVDIYNYHILNTTVTFEENEIPPEEMLERIQNVKDAKLPWLVAENEDVILGYAYASKWKGRCAYRFTVEVTVYIAESSIGMGWGTKLYQALLEKLRNQSYHGAIAGIALPNAPSIALHEKIGMEKVAHFKEVGFKFDQWVDVAYWQLNLEK